MVGVVLFVVTLQSLQRVSMSDTSQIISREYAKQKKKVKPQIAGPLAAK